MTRAEWIAEWLRVQGITSLWAVQGGAIAALIDACERTEGLEVYYAPSEVAAGYAASGATRAAGRLCAASLVTCGPGVLQVLPALACDEGDDVPYLCISGLPRAGDEFQALPIGENAPLLMDMIDLGGDYPGLYALPMDHALDVVHRDGPKAKGEVPYRRIIPRCFREWVARVTPTELPAAAEDIIRSIVREQPDDCLVFSDAGLTLAYCHRILHEQLGARWHAPWQQAPMGAAVPMAIGAHIATGKSCLAIIGDGSACYQEQSIQMTGDYYCAEGGVRVAILDNGGFGAIRRYQDLALGGRYYGTESPQTLCGDLLTGSVINASVWLR